jgi:LmbE family N-acetylglucosaminyl deacetylase
MATIVAFHAHPDDEVLLTGGTLARLSAEGHRVVVVVACDGNMWAATAEGAGRRMNELRASAAVLGVARVEHLGYADSGSGPVVYEDPPDRQRFTRADLDEAAGRLAKLLREEKADVLLSYDPQGGYHHLDHVKVHQVGGRAAQMVDSVRVLEATVPRELVKMLFRPVQLLRMIVRYRPDELRTGFTPRSLITHRVNVRRYAAQKQVALRAHNTPLYSRGRSARLFRLLVRLPTPIFGLLLGREWFVEPGATSANIKKDILA